jgi:hypothetical protein
MTGLSRVHPGEFDQLFNAILINVTDFFRDTPAWASWPKTSAAHGEGEDQRSPYAFDSWLRRRAGSYTVALL